MLPVKFKSKVVKVIQDVSETRLKAPQKYKIMLCPLVAQVIGNSVFKEILIGDL